MTRHIFSSLVFFGALSSGCFVEEPDGGGEMSDAPATGGVAIGGTASTGGLQGAGGAHSGGYGGGGAIGGRGIGGSLGPAAGGMNSGGTGSETSFNPCPTNGDPCKLLPFGDSITDGVGSSDGGGYRSRLFQLTLDAGEKITFVGSQSKGPSQVAGVAFPERHEGHSGWTIEPGYSTWAGGISDLVPAPAFDEPPHIVLLMIGTNDVTSDHGQDTMDERLDALVDEIVAAAPDALLVLAQITPLAWNPQALNEYNETIPIIVGTRAAQGQHIVSVDMNPMPSSGLGDDGVHPNDAGYEFMANIWHEAIAAYLPK